MPTPKAQLLRKLLHRGPTWLGCTEPTWCAADTKRLHATADVQTLMLRDADYARVQAGALPTRLPRVVQYDLFHAVEPLPETDREAATDQVHSFFYQAQAWQQLTDHLYAYAAQGVVPALLWHSIHPHWADTDYYRIRLTGKDPFALKGVADERALLVFVAQHLHLPRPEWPRGMTLDQALMLGTLQNKLDAIAQLANDAAARGIALLFRPLHEANGHWFWWSIRHFADDKAQAAAHFQALWSNMRRYLEEVRGVDNLLYVWSPNIKADWPGDEARLLAEFTEGILPDEVDVLGIDCYANNFNKSFQPERHFREESVWKGLEVIATLRRQFPDKPVGFTELGASYHKLLPGDDLQQPMGGPGRGAGTFSERILEKMSATNDPSAPHFCLFWRNEPQLMEFPLDAEGLALVQHLDTIPYTTDIL